MLGAGCTIRFHTIVYKTASKLLQLKHYLKMVENCVAILYAIYRKRQPLLKTNGKKGYRRSISRQNLFKQW